LSEAVVLLAVGARFPNRRDEALLAFEFQRVEVLVGEVPQEFARARERILDGAAFEA
jgi:hypothetical protein